MDAIKNIEARLRYILTKVVMMIDLIDELWHMASEFIGVLVSRLVSRHELHLQQGTQCISEQNVLAVDPTTAPRPCSKEPS